jgi:hypothetical protein
LTDDQVEKLTVGDRIKLGALTGTTNRRNRERFCHARNLEGKMTSKEVEQAIRALGLAVTRVDGKWRINYRGGKEATAYYTTDDDDALGMARAMEVARGQQ